MSRNPGKNHRSRIRERSPLTEYELTQQRVLEIERKLKEKDIRLAKEQKRLKKDYGLNVDVDVNRSPSMSPPIGYMSPIRIGVPDERERYEPSSPIRIGSSSPYRDDSPPSPPRRRRPIYESLTYQFERPRATNNQPTSSGFEHPPGYDNYKYSYPDHPHAAPLFNPIWRNELDVRIDPIPVFPVEGEDDKDEEEEEEEEEEESSPDSQTMIGSRREENRRQMAMIAQQAELAEQQEKRERQIKEKERREKEMKRKQEEEERQKAREHIEQMRKEVMDKLREEDVKKREIERKKRHALKKKEGEEEARRRAGKRKRDESATTVSASSSRSAPVPSESEVDEVFLQRLEPAFGEVKCEAKRIEGKNFTVYRGRCHVVNIPKDFLSGIHESSIKGSAYKSAISKYVDKLVALRIVDGKVRAAMHKIAKLPKFLADLVEPLCNDIAIYGTQISVTETGDQKSKFVAFAEEKSRQFWSIPENNEKLSNFMKKSAFPRSPEKKNSNREHRDRKERSGNRSERKRSATPSLSSKASLEVLFASNGTEGFTSIDQQSQTGLAPLMPLPVMPAPLMGSYQHYQQQPHAMQNYDTSTYSQQMMPVYMTAHSGQPQSLMKSVLVPQPLMQSTVVPPHMQPTSVHPQTSTTHRQLLGQQQHRQQPRRSTQEEEAELMDEIIT
ncbi:unnamed protein product [Caenorhabditis sp. 36 PRJEB53466]|nr:unnamed protein product [Caenorhabditis sp. 36 PRJEB53466]